MNKQRLIQMLELRAGLPKGDILRVVDAMFDEIIGEIKRGNVVNILGFGTFYVIRTASKNGRNPRTGAPIVIAAKNRVRFKASDSIMDSVN